MVKILSTMVNKENWIKIEKKEFCEGDFSDVEYLLKILTWKPKGGSLTKNNFFVDINATSIRDYDNFNNLSQAIRSKIIEQYKAAFMSSKNKNYSYLISKKTNYRKNEFSLEQAIRFFSKPVLIILENGLNDSYFLTAIFKYFDNSSQKLLEFYKNEWIKFENAGGWGGTLNSVQAQLKSNELFCREIGREEKHFIRCFVLMDSDKEFSIDKKDDKNAFKEKLEEMGVEVHILNKRAMENYMPTEVFDLPSNQDAQLKRWSNVYKTLNNEQKDFLNFEKGFKEKKGKVPRNSKKQEIIDLYPSNEISDKNYDILDDGIQYRKYKESFPKNFDSYVVHKKSLLTREGGSVDKNEFIDIINKIYKLL